MVHKTVNCMTKYRDFKKLLLYFHNDIYICRSKLRFFIHYRITIFRAFYNLFTYLSKIITFYVCE